MRTSTKAFGMAALLVSLLMVPEAPAQMTVESTWTPTQQELAFLTTPMTRTPGDGHWRMDVPSTDDPFEDTTTPDTYRDQNYELLLGWQQTEINA